MNIFGEILFWFLTITTCISGGGGFLLKIPGLYFPDAYIVNGEVGTGTTDFEYVATFVFACVYLCPIFGLLYAHIWESHDDAALRAACIAPMTYHAMSVVGIYVVFGRYLNPAVAPIHSAAGMHVFYALLFALLFWTAHTNNDPYNHHKRD